jgi:hypothetical protein
MTCYINATSSPNKHCLYLCIFHPTTYRLPPTKALKNKTHTSASEIIVGSQAHINFLPLHFPFSFPNLSHLLHAFILGYSSTMLNNFKISYGIDTRQKGDG